MSKSTNFSSKRFYANTGSKTKPIHTLKIDPDGTRFLVEIGIEETYEKIQSYKDGCSIENIIKRAMSGDLAVLNANPGVYADFTLIPNNLISAYKAVESASAFYRSIPSDVRSKFGSFENFLSNFENTESIAAYFESLTKENTVNEQAES